MHTLNRLLTCLVLFAVLIPPATFALVSLEEKTVAQEELQQAIGTAVHKYQQRSGLQSMQSKGERAVREQEEKIASLETRKRELRILVAKQKAILEAVQKRYGITFESKEQLQLLVIAEKRRMERHLKWMYLAGNESSNDPRSAVLNAVFHAAAAEHGREVVNRTQVKFLRDLVAAEKAYVRMETYAQQREEVLTEYWKAQKQHDQAVNLVARSAEQLEEIKRIMEEVHGQVLRMQGELARIDARLKAKAQRQLIEKGLLDPKSAGAGTAGVYKPQFSWPVYGRISAGFMSGSYKKFFGVPHHGLDIVVGQKTPVASAADGVVFFVRDGGAKGYSYILVGHRGGYATLYGHVSSSLVTAGQEVDAGQVIALSGGQPGTRGAGPMTTGAHLHFEVIKAGVNIDPKSVLP